MGFIEMCVGICAAIVVSSVIWMCFLWIINTDKDLGTLFRLFISFAGVGVCIVIILDKYGII